MGLRCWIGNSKVASVYQDFKGANFAPFLWFLAEATGRSPAAWSTPAVSSTDYLLDLTDAPEDLPTQ